MTNMHTMADRLSGGLQDVVNLFASQPQISLVYRERMIARKMTDAALAAFAHAGAATQPGTPDRTVAVLYAEALFHLAHMHSSQWPREYARLFGSSDVPFGLDFAHYCMDVVELLDLTYEMFRVRIGVETMPPLLEPHNVPVALDHAAAMSYVRFNTTRKNYTGMGLYPQAEPEPVVDAGEAVPEDATEEVSND